LEDSDGVVENLAAVTPPPALDKLLAARQQEPEPEPAAGAQRPGDFNQDGELNISDVTGVLRFLFRNPGAVPPPCADEGEEDGEDDAEGGYLLLLDADGSGHVDIADAIRLFEYLFREGPPHVLGTDCVEIEGCPDVCRR
jgi:hypothetical protein